MKTYNLNLSKFTENKNIKFVIKSSKELQENYF